MIINITDAFKVVLVSHLAASIESSDVLSATLEYAVSSSLNKINEENIDNDFSEQIEDIYKILTLYLESSIDKIDHTLYKFLKEIA